MFNTPVLQVVLLYKVRRGVVTESLLGCLMKHGKQVNFEIEKKLPPYCQEPKKKAFKERCANFLFRVERQE